MTDDSIMTYRNGNQTYSVGTEAKNVPLGLIIHSGSKDIFKGNKSHAQTTSEIVLSIRN